MQAAAVLPYWCVLIVGFAAQLSRMHLSLPYELRWNEFVSKIQPSKAAKLCEATEASGMRGTSKRSRIYYTKGRARGRESQFVSSTVSIVSTVEARDDGATVDALSMRRRVSAMCAPHHSAASPDVRKSRMRRVSPMRARTDA